MKFIMKATLSCL